MSKGLEQDQRAGRPDFVEELFVRMFTSCYQYQEKFWDSRRFGPEPKLSLVERIKRRIKTLGAGRGWVARHFSVPVASRLLADVVKNSARYARVYDLMADDYSKRLFLDIILFRILGPQHVRMPLNTPDYWEKHKKAGLLFSHINSSSVLKAGQWRLGKADVMGDNGPLSLYLAAFGAYALYGIRYYDYRHTKNIRVEDGDTVIDAGACWGEMSCYFADRAGENGRVFAFEFNPDNLKIFRENLALNPRIASHIEVIENALHEKSGERMAYEPNGPGTSIEKKANDGHLNQTVATETIDDFVSRRTLSKIDFIKMDVEGAELWVLKGAEKTLRHFGPKLAISVYHRPDDLLAIPEYIDRLRIGYSFYLDHFTVHSEETVLFCVRGL